jgi:hypothetical protein
MVGEVSRIRHFNAPTLLNEARNIKVTTVERYLRARQQDDHVRLKVIYLRDLTTAYRQTRRCSLDEISPRIIPLQGSTTLQLIPTYIYTSFTKNHLSRNCHHSVHIRERLC